MFVLSYQTSRHLVLKEIKLTFHMLLVCHCSDTSHIVLVVVACCWLWFTCEVTTHGCQKFETYVVSLYYCLSRRGTLRHVMI